MSTQPHPAEQLLVQASQTVRLGKLAEASRLMEQAAQIYASDGRADDQSRCLALAATAARMAGAVSAAHADAVASSEVAAAGSATAVQAAAEVAESLVAAGKPAEAIDGYTRALEQLHATPEPRPAAEAVLLRKRGLARALADLPDEAIADLEAAAAAFGVAGEARAQRAVMVEVATLASERGDARRGLTLRGRARTEARRAKDTEALVDLDLLDASVAVTAKDLDSALSFVEHGRRRALDGVSPLKYLSAALAQSELHDLRGERERAYESLSTAWATLGDLMGPEVARSVVQPRLQLLVDRWGADEFAAVKSRYEARRRAELGLR